MYIARNRDRKVLGESHDLEYFFENFSKLDRPKFTYITSLYIIYIYTPLSGVFCVLWEDIYIYIYIYLPY